MDGDKIEQQVTISDHAQVGDVTVIGKIVNIIKQPSIWQEAIWQFLSRHRGFIGVWIALEIGLFAIYAYFKNLYLIRFDGWMLVAALFAVALWNLYKWLQHGHARINAVLSSVAVVPFFVLVGWQATQIAFPQKFEPQVFAIAVAELGEGPNAQSTSRTKELSAQVYERLCLAIRDELAAGADTDPCARNNQGSAQRLVEVRRLGVIPDSHTAQEYGRRIGADVVIWGQILRSAEGEATVRFQVLESFDRAVNPDFPLVLPVSVQFTEVFVKELDLDGDPVKLKKLIADQTSIMASFAVGLSEYLERDYLQAAILFEKALKTIEGNQDLFVSPEGKSLIYFYLGRSYYAVARFEEGHQWLELAREANPKEPAVPLSLAIGYGSQGLLEERQKYLLLALDLSNDWLDSRPDDNVATYNRGLINQILTEHDYAILDYEAVVERDPNFYIAYISLGQSASALEDYVKAEDAFRKAIELASGSGTNPVWAYLNLALAYEKAGDPESAKAEFQNAIKADQQVDAAYLYYARFLENQKEMDAALDAYKTILDITWDKGWGHSNLAGFYKRRGLLSQALENYKRAIFYKREDSLLRTYLAETYAGLGDPEKAISEFEAGINLPGNTYYSYASYAAFLFQQGNYDLAAEMYEESLKRRPVDSSVLLNLGQTYEILGKKEKAKTIYQQIISMKDQFSEEVLRIAQERLIKLGGNSP